MKQEDASEYKDGWYQMFSPEEKEPTLVYLYTNPDNGLRGFGYNIKDGGGFLPLEDMRDDCWVVEATLKISDELIKGTMDALMNMGTLQIESNSAILVHTPSQEYEDLTHVLDALNRAFSMLMANSGKTNVHILVLPKDVDVNTVNFEQDVVSLIETIRKKAVEFRTGYEGQTVQ